MNLKMDSSSRPLPRIRTAVVQAQDKQSSASASNNTDTVVSATTPSPETHHEPVNNLTHQRFVFSDPVAFRFVITSSNIC
jgi:hypothetical protein